MIPPSSEDSDARDYERPHWTGSPSLFFDAGPLIKAGGHPLQRVLSDLQSMAVGETYELLTPFVPVPLLEIARDKGFLAWSAQRDSSGIVRSYFTRNGPESRST
jgi:hypothetical protein